MLQRGHQAVRLGRQALSPEQGELWPVCRHGL